LWYIVVCVETAPKSIVVNIRLDRETLAEVDSRAVEEGRTRSNLLIWLIKSGLRPRRGKKPAKVSR
jgi:hypothetical protein